MADTLPDLVNLTAVEAQLGEILVAPEVGQVEVFIERTIAEMLKEAPNLPADLEAGRLNPVIVKGVGADVVIRALESLRIGFRVTQQDFPETSTRYAAGSDEWIFLTPAQVARITVGESQDRGQNGCYVVGLGG